MGQLMAVMAAHALGLGPEACEAHGTYLIARNGANVLVGANENWFRSVTDNELKLHVGCTTNTARRRCTDGALHPQGVSIRVLGSRVLRAA